MLMPPLSRGTVGHHSAYCCRRICPQRSHDVLSAPRVVAVVHQWRALLAEDPDEFDSRDPLP